MNKTLTKFFAVVGVVALVGGAVIGGMQLWAPAQYKPSNWGTHAPAGNNGGNEGGEENAVGSLVIDPDLVVMNSCNLEVAPMSLDEVSTHADTATAYTVTATARYEDGSIALDEDQYFLFSLKWKTEKSALCSDYVDLQFGNRSATLSLVKVFDTQIILECVHAFNPNVNGIVTIDCVKRATNVVADLSGNSNENIAIQNNAVVDTVFKNADRVDNSNWYMPKFEIVRGVNYGVGTVEDELISCSALIELTDEFKTALTAKLPSFISANAYKTSTKTANLNNGVPVIKVSQQELTTMLTGHNELFTTEVYMGTFKEILSSTSNQVKITVNMNFKYCGAQTVTYYLNIGFDTQISGVDLDKDSIIL